MRTRVRLNYHEHGIYGFVSKHILSLTYVDGDMTWSLDKPHKLDASLGYQYYLYKFGNNHNDALGLLANTVFGTVRYRF